MSFGNAAAESASPAPHPFHLLLRCSNTLLREAGRLLASNGITAAQFNVLNLVALSADGARPTDIANDLVVDPSSATYLIKQLCRDGLLERSPDPRDRRAYRLILTPLGQRKTTDARAAYLPALADLTGSLPAPDVAALEPTLALLLQTVPTVVERHLANATHSSTS